MHRFETFAFTKVTGNDVIQQIVYDVLFGEFFHVQ